MKTNLNKMNCREFTEYLKSNKLDYTEIRDWDPSGKDYIKIIPRNKRYKARMFLETRITTQVKYQD